MNNKIEYINISRDENDDYIPHALLRMSRNLEIFAHRSVWADKIAYINIDDEYEWIFRNAHIINVKTLNLIQEEEKDVGAQRFTNRAI